MNKKLLFYLIILILILITSEFSWAEWKKAQNISFIKNNLYCYNPIISSSKEILAIAWEEKIISGLKKSTQLKIAYGKSEKNFIKKILYKTQKDYNLHPKILIKNNFIFVVYSTPFGEINFIRGKNNGKSWTASKTLTFSSGTSFEPEFYFDEKNNKIYIFYLEQNKGNYLLKYITSNNNGKKWNHPQTVLNSKELGLAIFNPSIIINEEKINIIYQGKNITESEKSKDNIYISIVNQKNMKILKTDEVLDETDTPCYLPITDKNNSVLVFSKYIENTWNIYACILDDDKSKSCQKINSQNKSCYNHTALFMPNYTKIFYAMMDENNSQIYTRKLYKNKQKLGKEKKAVITTGNSYSPQAAFFKQAEYLLWQEEYNKNKSAIFLQKQDTIVACPIIIKPGKGWHSSTDLQALWKSHKDSSGLAGYGYTISTSPQHKGIIQNLPTEINSLSLKNSLQEGTNYFNLKSFDNAGNVSTVSSKIIKIDYSGPVIKKIHSPTHPRKIFTDNKTAEIHIKATDNYQKVAGYFYYIDYGKNIPSQKKVITRKNIFKLKLKQGVSYLKVCAVDTGGNWGNYETYPFYITKKKPLIIASLPEKKVHEKELSPLKQTTIQKELIEKKEKKLSKQKEIKKTTLEETTEILKPEKTEKKKSIPLKQEKKISLPEKKQPEKKEQPQKITALTKKSLEKKTKLSTEEKEKEKVVIDKPSIKVKIVKEGLNTFLKESYTIHSIPVFKPVTKNIIGKPENIIINDINIDDSKYKQIQFDIFIKFKKDGITNRQIYVWSPVLNNCNMKSKFPFIPVYIIKENKFYKGKLSEYNYFKVAILTPQDNEFFVILTIEKKLMTGAVIWGKNSKDKKIIPPSLRWLLYE